LPTRPPAAAPTAAPPQLFEATPPITAPVPAPMAVPVSVGVHEASVPAKHRMVKKLFTVVTSDRRSDRQISRNDGRGPWHAVQGLCIPSCEFMLNRDLHAFEASPLTCSARGVSGERLRLGFCSRGICAVLHSVCCRSRSDLRRSPIKEPPLSKAISALACCCSQLYLSARAIKGPEPCLSADAGLQVRRDLRMIQWVVTRKEAAAPCRSVVSGPATVCGLPCGTWRHPGSHGRPAAGACPSDCGAACQSGN
jgi:hypothetical protein